MKLQWNPKANPKSNLRWGVRLFHDANWHCLRIPPEKRAYGNERPEGYFPCEVCFPCGSKKRKSVL